MIDNTGRIRKSREVALALAFSTPVVALETAVLTHGLPRGAALEIYLEMCAAVRGEGAIPAPVGVLGGEVVVGLTPDELEALRADSRAVKAAIPDLPALAGLGGSGGTTAGATLFAARSAGVTFVATGGIGGVHRGAEATFDLSGDLAALARLGGVLVSSGAKSILDLPKTWELLETLGITVVGYRTSALPAFTRVDSGILLRHRVENPAEAASVVRAAQNLGAPQTLLVANPPPEGEALGEEEERAALEEALSCARSEGVTGPALTPHLLSAMARATGGSSVRANRALLLSNATLAARIAVELAA